MIDFFILSSLLQAADLAEYSAKIALLEEMQKEKEEEAESWHSKVRISGSTKTQGYLEMSEAFPARCLLLLTSLFFKHAISIFFSMCVLFNTMANEQLAPYVVFTVGYKHLKIT